MTTTAIRPVEISPADHLQLNRALTSFQSLLSLDHAWTGLAERSGGLADDDRLNLVVLGGQLLTTLQEADTGAAWLHDFVLQARPDGLREALQAVAETAPPRVSDEIHGLDVELGDQIGPLTEFGYQSLRGSLDDQRQAIARDLGRLLGAGQPEGDLFKNVLCAVSALTFVGGVVSIALPPHVHGVAIAKAGAVGFKAFGCKVDQFEDSDDWRIRPKAKQSKRFKL